MCCAYLSFSMYLYPVLHILPIYLMKIRAASEQIKNEVYFFLCFYVSLHHHKDYVYCARRNHHHDGNSLEIISLFLSMHCCVSDSSFGIFRNFKYQQHHPNMPNNRNDIGCCWLCRPWITKLAIYFPFPQIKRAEIIDTYHVLYFVLCDLVLIDRFLNFKRKLMNFKGK